MQTLYGLDRKGIVRQWSAEAIQMDDGTAVKRKRYGIVGKKITERDTRVKKGKNIGKTNATTPFTQAQAEIISGYDGKVHENYVDYIPDPATFKPPFILPQLAKDPGKIVFPCAMQRKLNGVCDLSHNQHKFDAIHHHSRGGHFFETVKHTDPILKEILNPFQLGHGELYYHDWSLQKISGYTKKLRDDSEKLGLWIYDTAYWVDGRPKVGPTFEDRWADLLDTVNGDIHKYAPHVRFNETIIVHSYEEARKYHDQWIADGFEGGMLRNLKGVYVFQFRTNDLEKMKDFQEAEFIITGGHADLDGCVVFECETKDGGEFNVRPKGSVELRQGYLSDLDNIIRKRLTTKFEVYSDDGIPLKPVGLVIRDYE